MKAITRAQRDANGNQLPPMLMIQIIEGGNDALDGGTLGPLSATRSIISTTGEYQSAIEDDETSTIANGYYNNTVTILRRFRYVWENVCGYSRDGLFFLIGCYHPQSPTISPSQFAFVRTSMVTGMAAVGASEPNVCSVDGYKLGSYAEFGVVDGQQAADTGADGTDYITAAAPSISTTGAPFTAEAHVPWYRNPSNEDAHLNQPGYMQWGMRVVGAVMDAARSAPGGLSESQTLIIPIPLG